jgi:hypothetical protein
MHKSIIDNLPNQRSVRRLNLAIAVNVLDMHVNHIWTIIKLYPVVSYTVEYIATHKHTSLYMIMKYGGSLKRRLTKDYFKYNEYVTVDELDYVSHKII